MPHNRWDNGQPIDVDSDGWVRRLASGQAVATLMCWNAGGQYPGGDYTCLFDGDGDLEFMLDAQVVERDVGRLVVRVTPGRSDGIWMRLTRTNQQNPLRNLRLVMPGFEDTYQDEPFHPEFLARWSKFKVLRFMDWQRTNNSRIAHWSERATPGRVNQTGPGGVALEHMIALCNKLDADPWLCIPLHADLGYVQQFATMLQAQLEPERKVYLEHSNEVWNGVFQQNRDAAALGRARNLAGTDHEAAMYFHGLRTVEVGAAVEAVMGGDRVVRTLGMQAATPWWVDHLLGYGEVWRGVDAVAVAPYVGNDLGDPTTQNTVVNMSVEQVIGFLLQDTQRMMGNVRQAVTHCANRNLDLVAYEGGQHLVGYAGAENNQALTNLFIRVNGDPAMETVYTAYLDAWKQTGAHMCVLYSSLEGWSKWGSWGMVRSPTADLTREWKYKAAVDFIGASPRWW